MELRALYIDFNSYFASCEQHFRPELRGKPVGIVPMADVETTCCIAASYEAKAFGVKTGTRVADARALCPGIQLIPARHKQYVRMHKAMVAAVESCLPVLKVLSIDEMVCELPPSWRNREKALEVAHRIKECILLESGPAMTSSIGIAPNIFLAKTGTELQKPNGLVVLEEKDLPGRLYELELRDLCGIGARMLTRLQGFGIRTVERLCNTSRDKLARIWGSVEGARMHDRLKGLWIPLEETTRTTVGHSRVLPPEFRSEEASHALCHRLLQKAALRMRDMGYYTGELSFSMRYLSGPRWGASITFEETQDTVALTNALETLWGRKPVYALKPLKVSVTLSRLTLASQHTPSLFDTETTRKRAKLDRAMDALNRTMGASTVYYGGSHEALKAAPMRIAFTHIPDASLEIGEGS